MTQKTKKDLYEEVLPYLTIDINNLQEELVKHAANYAYLSQKFAQAKGRLADLKTTLEYQKGVALIESKQLSFTDGLGKESAITDTLARACVDANDSVVEVKRQMAQAEHEQAFWQSVMEALYQRSYMLTKLVDMQQHELMLAGNEYNEGIRQDMRRLAYSQDEYDHMTRDARAAKRATQMEMVRESVRRSGQNDG